MTTMAAVDLGAQSGRVAVGTLDGDRLSVAEVHRFPNVPVEAHETLYWDPFVCSTRSRSGWRPPARARPTSYPWASTRGASTTDFSTAGAG